MSLIFVFTFPPTYGNSSAARSSIKSSLSLGEIAWCVMLGGGTFSTHDLAALRNRIHTVQMITIWTIDDLQSKNCRKYLQFFRFLFVPANL